jgi:hypothetical protein
MHIRSTAVLFAALALAGVGCSGSHYQPPPNTARTVGAPALPQETTSVSGANAHSGSKVSAEPAKTAPTPPSATGGGPHNSNLSPPPSAGTSTPLPNSPAPYKPGNEQAPNTGGGPKTETGGAVYGDGNEGNTGAIKGGDPSAPPKQ